MPSITPRPASPVIIRDARELLAFSGTPAFFGNRPLVLDGFGEPATAAPLAVERLNAYRTECGCSAGARAMTAAFSIAFVLLTIRYGVSPLAILAHLPLAAVAGLAGGALGKVAGIALAHRRAHLEVARLLTALSGSS